jgi:hypothetical protein
MAFRPETGCAALVSGKSRAKASKMESNRMARAARTRAKRMVAGLLGAPAKFTMLTLSSAEAVSNGRRG